MTDLLLHNLRTIGTHHCDGSVGEEAAQEIERLRDEIARLRVKALDHDAVKMMATVIEKGHRYVLCVEPAGDNPSSMTMHNTDRRGLARMLGRFHRAAVEDAKWPGDDDNGASA